MFQLPRLAGVRGLVHAYSTTEEGNQSFKYGELAEVVENRRRFLEAVWGAPGASCLERCVSARVNSRECGGVAVVGKKHAGQGMLGGSSGLFCEGMITASEEIALFLLAADCSQMILYAPIERVAGLVHVGRESLLAGIVSEVLGTLQNRFKVSLRNLLVGLGPGIRKPSYFLEKLPPAIETDLRWRDFLEETASGFTVDLYGFTKMVLAEAGVNPRHVEDCGIDTFTDERFFSHRRSKTAGEPAGRHACVVGMVPVS